MIVLRILGILLLILLGLFVLTVCILCSTIRIAVQRDIPDGALCLSVGFGMFKREVILGDKKKKTKPKKEQKKKPEKKREPKPSRFDFKKLDFEQAFVLALDLIDDLAGSITWERLHVTLIIHTPDAARTGNLLGALSAIVGNIYPYMERAFVLQDTRIILDADFDAEKTVWGIDIIIMTRIGRYPRILWRRRKALWELWKSIRPTDDK